LFSTWAASAQSSSDKLEAYFSFDNYCKAIDDSGNGSSGVLVNDLACICGIRDSALRFDGMNDALYLVGPLADVFTTSDFTVSFYMKPPDNQTQGGSQLVMSKQSGCNLNRTFWVRYAAKFQKISATISENDSLVVTVQAALDNAPCWQLITITRSNTRFSIYVNGVLKETKTSPVRIDLTSTATLKVGEPVCPLDQPYKGEFDELRFHSKALNEDEIARYNLRADRILNNDTLIYLGNSFQVNTSQICGPDYFWQPSAGVSNTTISNPQITPLVPTLYTVDIVYDGGGCIAHDSIFVNVIDPDTLDCNVIFIPNAFTPGASAGRNDVFGISNPFAITDFISFEIFDRWGGRVFNAATPFETWDGNLQGQPANPGVFLYRLRYNCNGVEKVRAGNLTLLR